MIDRLKYILKSIDIYTVERGDALIVYKCYWDNLNGYAVIVFECEEDCEIRIMNRVMTAKEMADYIYKYIEEREEITK